MACYTCVDHNTVQVIEKFGKFSRMAEPGCTMLNCLFGESVRGQMSLRVQQLDVQCDTKTKDNVFVSIVVSVQFQVNRDAVWAAFYELTDSRTQITSYVYDVVRSTVPKMNLDDTFTSKIEIAESVKAQLSENMSRYGYQILQALLVDIAPDAGVKSEMNEINAAARLRVASQHKAEAEKVMVVKAAEADAEAKYLAGTGIARQRQAIINGLRESVRHFQAEISDVSSKEVMDLMLVTQYFDMLKEVGVSSKATSVFIPHGSNGSSDAIRNGVMQGSVAGL